LLKASVMNTMGIRTNATHTAGGAEDGAFGGLAMSDRWDEFFERDEERHRGKRHRSRRRRTRRERPSGRSRGRSVAQTEEQRLYRQASRRATAKLSFVTHLVTYGAVVVMLLFVAGFRAAFYTGFGWGIFVVLHYFAVLIAPALRRRFIENEVSQEDQQNAGRERRVLEGEHARSLEQLSASIAHEIRNPITAAKSLVQQMGEDPASRENVEYANVALEELDRVERSISHLLRFARDEEIRVEELSLVDVVDSALETFHDRLARSGVAVLREIDSAGWMQGDAEKIRRVLINLVGNALDALEQAGTSDPSLAIAAGENLAGTEVWLRVRDNGPGIEPEALNDIFSPFYTSKATGNGLGLAISKKVVDAHGGSIEAESAPGSGTEFVLTFPKRAPGPEASA
jgi:signal transduction histidine kinase